MPRADELDLRALDKPWRRVPMEGADRGIDVVPLTSSLGALTMLARFPVGFARLTPGGYAVSEEFLVIEGELEFEGVRRGPGSLAFIPARFLRTSLVAPGGCTVLAWWGGPAEFVAADRLDRPVREGLTSVDVLSSQQGPLLHAEGASWVHQPPGAPAPTADADVVDLAMTRWHRASARQPAPDEPYLLRSDPPAGSASRPN